MSRAAALYRAGLEHAHARRDRLDDFQANRAPDGRYRTAPLAGLWTHTRGGFYHDGRFAKLADVIQHYDRVLSLDLSDAERADLEQYLRSL